MFFSNILKKWINPKKRKAKKYLMKKALEEKTNELKKLPYEELLKRTNEEIEGVEHGVYGADDYYQMEIQIFLEDDKGTIRVMVSIDDNGFRPAFCDGFLITPQGLVD